MALLFGAVTLRLILRSLCFRAMLSMCFVKAVPMPLFWCVSCTVMPNSALCFSAGISRNVREAVAMILVFLSSWITATIGSVLS